MNERMMLSDSQVAALRQLVQGPADFYELLRAGSSGVAVTWVGLEWTCCRENLSRLQNLAHHRSRHELLG